MIKQLLCTQFFICLFTYSVFATDYYVSSDGNDLLNGQSEVNAWKTINKINTTAFNPGDRILFRRGDTFRGRIRPISSGAAGNPITFGAYGTAATAPIICGTERLTGTWTLDGGNVWKYDVSAYPISVKQVFVNGEKKFISRYPNTGFLYVNTKNSTTSFSSTNSDLVSKASSFFTNSSIAIRSKEWYWFNRKVASVNAGTVVTTTAINDEPDPNEGYYFYGSRDMIDTEGEWYYDATAKKLYYQHSSSSTSPADIEATVQDYGFAFVNLNYFTVQDLIIEKQGLSGIYIDKSSNNTFTNLVIRNCGNDGITTYWYQSATTTPQSNNTTVSNCTISDCNFNGIFIQHSSNWNISNNTISAIGTQYPGYYPGYDGYPSNQVQTGIMVAYLSTTNTVANNTISNIAKSGIQVVGPNNIIEKNIISDFGKTYADLGGIYLTTSYSKNNIIQNNFCYNGTSYTDAWNKFTTYDVTLSTAAKRTAGLYGDESVSDNTWQYNTSYNNDFTGMQTVKGINEKYYNNITYKNGEGKNEFQVVKWGAGIIVKNNTFYSRPSSAIFGFWDPTSNLLAEVDGNRYINTFRGTQWIGDFAGTKKNITEWKAIYADDIHSKTSYFSTATTTEEDGSQLFTNPTAATVSIPLTGSGTWYDLDGNVVNGSITIPPFYSAILVFKAGVLPVSLIDFNAKANAFGIRLAWTVASERNNDRFEIERSVNGSDFKFMKSVAGKGTSNTSDTYSIIDSSPTNGVNYYKLIQYDRDGKASELGVVNARFSISKKSGMVIYPNPLSSSTVYFSMPDLAANNFTVSLLSLDGRILVNEKMPANSSNNYSLKLKEKPASGQYILKVISPDFVESKILIVQ